MLEKMHETAWTSLEPLVFTRIITNWTGSGCGCGWNAEPACRTQSQAGLDLWEVLENHTKMQGTALTALEPLVFPRISTEIGLVLAPAVDGMLSQPVT